MHEKYEYRVEIILLMVRNRFSLGARTAKKLKRFVYFRTRFYAVCKETFLSLPKCFFLKAGELLGAPLSATAPRRRYRLVPVLFQ